MVFNNIGDLELFGVEFNFVYCWDFVDVYFGFLSVDVELMFCEGLYSVFYNSIDINGYEFVGLGNSCGDMWVFGVDYIVIVDISVGFNIIMVDDINIDILY